ncbi:MAG TPA: YaiO family outer membrane beta-barrel protein, partial [Gemmatimonadales bacterium]|nr:YaiO family outer membrane beta-barrel protein [Gemmatimonadales bacterium]
MILALVALLQGPAPVDTLPHWRADLSYAVDHHTRDRSDWTFGRAAFGHRRGTTVALADLWTAERFDTRDQGGGLELYLRPSPRTGLYLRGDLAPDARVLPTGGAVVSVTRGLRGGWEGTAHYRRMEYRDAGFDLYGAGVGRYQGRWYLRADATVIPHEGTTGATVGVAARRYGRSGDLDDLVELRLDTGREVVLLGAATPPTLRRTAAVALWGQRVLGRGWGIRGTLG